MISPPCDVAEQVGLGAVVIMLASDDPGVRSAAGIAALLDVTWRAR